MQEDLGRYQMKWLRYMESSLISVECYNYNSWKTDGSSAQSSYTCKTYYTLGSHRDLGCVQLVLFSTNIFFSVINFSVDHYSG